MAEALNGSFKAELIEHQGPWRDADQVEHAVVQWVGWYNTERLHSALDYLPLEEFEAAYYRSLATSNAAWRHANRPLRNSRQLIQGFRRNLEVRDRGFDQHSNPYLRAAQAWIKCSAPLDVTRPTGRTTAPSRTSS
ncbi:transposase [Streptomyces sp. HUCO-GS316]|nr:transposase [Streptomyces sp. HUCO-GS316]